MLHWGMAFWRWGFFIFFLWQSSAFATDAYTLYQNLYNSSSTPANWTADFAPGAFTHCEMSSSSSRNQVRSVLFGLCVFNDGTQIYQAPCYLPAGGGVAYGFVLNDSPSVYGNSLRLQGKDLTVLNVRSVVIAQYRRNGAQMTFQLGTTEISYGSCAK
jgi:hypothetical protein